MSFDDHDRCRRCGTPDGPGHTAAECERVMAQRREVQRAHDSQKTAPDSSLPLVPSDRCGHAGPCGWMRAAAADPQRSGTSFARREMEHPDTLRPVVRYVVALASTAPRIVRACPACGGNPNETQAMR